MPEEPRYAIGDLADLGGVSRRTVRYYVQEGLLPTPLGVGRGNHYGRQHLDRLLRVKALQEAGQSLEEIRRALHGDEAPVAASWPLVAASRAAVAEPPFARQVWRRLTLAPGVELHVSADVRLPSTAGLAELAGWCLKNLPGGEPSGDPGV